MVETDREHRCGSSAVDTLCLRSCCLPSPELKLIGPASSLLKNAKILTDPAIALALRVLSAQAPITDIICNKAKTPSISLNTPRQLILKLSQTVDATQAKQLIIEQAILELNVTITTFKIRRDVVPQEILDSLNSLVAAYRTESPSSGAERLPDDNNQASKRIVSHILRARTGSASKNKSSKATPAATSDNPQRSELIERIKLLEQVFNENLSAVPKAIRAIKSQPETLVQLIEDTLEIIARIVAIEQLLEPSQTHTPTQSKHAAMVERLALSFKKDLRHYLFMGGLAECASISRVLRIVEQELSSGSYYTNDRGRTTSGISSASTSTQQTTGYQLKLALQELISLIETDAKLRAEHKKEIQSDESSPDDLLLKRINTHMELGVQLPRLIHSMLVNDQSNNSRELSEILKNAIFMFLDNTIPSRSNFAFIWKLDSIIDSDASTIQSRVRDPEFLVEEYISALRLYREATAVQTTNIARSCAANYSKYLQDFTRFSGTFGLTKIRHTLLEHQTDSSLGAEEFRSTLEYLNETSQNMTHIAWAYENQMNPREELIKSFGRKIEYLARLAYLLYLNGLNENDLAALSDRDLGSVALYCPKQRSNGKHIDLQLEAAVEEIGHHVIEKLSRNKITALRLAKERALIDQTSLADFIAQADEVIEAETTLSVNTQDAVFGIVTDYFVECFDYLYNHMSKSLAGDKQERRMIKEGLEAAGLLLTELDAFGEKMKSKDQISGEVLHLPKMGITRGSRQSIGQIISKIKSAVINDLRAAFPDVSALTVNLQENAGSNPVANGPDVAISRAVQELQPQAT